MNIGILVYSQTGHTLEVAEKLSEKLTSRGHSATIERIEPEGEVNPGMKSVSFTSKPDPAPYDAVVFASPVQAFSLSVAMKSYLAQIPRLEGKKVVLFVTKQLPGRWTGGNRAIRQMARFCEEKGGDVLRSDIVFWSSKERDKDIEEVVETLSAAL
ncbi:MAG: flavodoxin family protein [Spirochaetia bacterium]